MSAQSELLLALAARCEREEPSRELDEAIAASVAGATLERQKDGRPAYHRDGFWVSVGEVKHFTTSLDAAVTLVLWVLLNLSDIGPAGMFYCRLGETVTPCREVISEGARTLTLALCAAALRALAAIAKAPLHQSPKGNPNPV